VLPAGRNLRDAFEARHQFDIGAHGALAELTICIGAPRHDGAVFEECVRSGLADRHLPRLARQVDRDWRSSDATR